MSEITKEEVLKYHKKGKIGIDLTKPCSSQHELSLAYTPGVAIPCLEIAKDENMAFEYTNKANLVAVVSDGTAVLGLGLTLLQLFLMVQQCLDLVTLVPWLLNLLWKVKRYCLKNLLM
jgi:hypothetical protein